MGINAYSLGPVLSVAFQFFISLKRRYGVCRYGNHSNEKKKKKKKVYTNITKMLVYRCNCRRSGNESEMYSKENKNSSWTIVVRVIFLYYMFVD